MGKKSCFGSGVLLDVTNSWRIPFTAAFFCSFFVFIDVLEW